MAERFVPPWNFKHAEVRRIAVEKFDVGHPIELRTRRRVLQTNGLLSVERTTYGWHVWRGDMTHEFLIVTGIGQTMYSQEKVLRVLAHELHHAWQAEHFSTPSEWSRAYDKHRGSYEAYARAAERRWKTLKPTINERSTT